MKVLIINNNIKIRKIILKIIFLRMYCSPNNPCNAFLQSAVDYSKISLNILYQKK